MSYKRIHTYVNEVPHSSSAHRPVNKEFGILVPVIKTFVSNVNLSRIRPRRAGVIIYTVSNGRLYFAMGLDSNTHDLTDFGGTVEYETDENAVKGALREFSEETLGIF